MLKSKLSALLLVLFVSLGACTDDDMNNDIQNQIEESVKTSSWRITKYIDSGNDELNHFTGFNFTFGENNTLSASNGTNTYTGTWSVTNNIDDSQDNLEFNIFFASPPDFQELSDDWDIIFQSSTKIELIDISGGNGGTDYLTFEKN
jgi:hypothetical protein